MGCANARPAPVVVEKRGAQYHLDALRTQYDEQVMVALGDAAAQDGIASCGVQMDATLPLHVQPSCSEQLPCFGMTDSEPLYAQPNQTVIIFDWDDTLCPTSWANDWRASGKNNKKVLGLPQLSLKVAYLLSKAKQLGHVAIVTNAARPWVETSCEVLMPQVQSMLDGIPVIYSRELLSNEEASKYSKTELLTESKFRAMHGVITNFYSRYKQQSWKNIVSIGDSRYERDAIRKVAENGPDPSMVMPAKPRTKTIKLSRRQDLKEMCVQLTILSRWLSKIIHADRDLAIDFGDTALQGA